MQVFPQDRFFNHFADDTSVIHDINLSQIDLNEDSDKTNNWAYQWNEIER